jgi:lysophospholipase L1-like esterase
VSRRVLAVIVVVVVVGGVVILVTSSRNSPAATTRGGYLALGDSVTFGYREANTVPPPVYTDPASFVGYPEDVGAALGLPVTNAACRGATSSQFVTASAASLGCPLHVAYTQSQIQFATSFLQRHHNTTLVTLMIGINDVLNCQEHTTDNCSRELPRILRQLSTNVTTVLTRLRAVYHGTIVVVNYYPINYLGANHSLSVNKTVDAAASSYHVIVANGWTAFAAASAGSSGNACVAGLLTQLVGGGCGIHPSVAGQAVLALAVEEALRSNASTTTTTTVPTTTCPTGFRLLRNNTCVAG